MTEKEYRAHPEMPAVIKISESKIKEIIATYYKILTDDVCLYSDYEFIRKGDDKKRRDFIYGIVDLRNSERWNVLIDRERI